MLAMHYRFELPDRDAIDAVDARVRERGPMFDGFPDMGHKWFLIDRETPCYAVFYLWHDAAGPTAFLDGPLCANLARTFGRPEVRLLLARSVLLPEPEPNQAFIVEDDAGLAAVRAFVEYAPNGVVLFKLRPRAPTPMAPVTGSIVER